MPFSEKATIYQRIAGVLLLSMHLCQWAVGQQEELVPRGIPNAADVTTEHPTANIAVEDATTTTYYEIALQFSKEENPFFNPDSAYHYARMASTTFKKASKREQKRLKNAGITLRQINGLRSKQKEAALEFAIAQNTVSAIDQYLSNYPRAKDEWKARALRHKFELQFEQLRTQATYRDLLNYLTENDELLNRYYPNLLPQIHELAFNAYFTTRDSSKLVDVLFLIKQIPELAGRSDQSLSKAIAATPYLAIIEPALKNVKKEAIPLSMNEIYHFYAKPGQDRHLYTFARKYPEFKTSPHFNRDLAIANLGPKIQGRRLLKKDDLVSYIKMGAPRYLAFEALQILVKRDIDIQNWNGAIRTINEYAPYFGDNNPWINDLIAILETELPESKPENLGLGLNSEKGEYAVVPTADESKIYFCRGESGEEDIYFSKKVDGKWSTAQPIQSLNTEGQYEAPVSISGDGNTLLYFKNGRVMHSYRTTDGWTAAKPLFTDVQASEWQGGTSISADGNVIIFAARRPNRIGFKHDDNTDLFVVTKQADGSWSRPENLGLTINTTLEDRSPFLHPDMRTLYFSSNGHGGLGELDVFKTTRIGDSWTNWTTPVNLGKSINTTGKDWGYRISTDGQKAYFSTRVPMFGDDLFMIDLPEFAKPNAVSTVKGTLVGIDGQALNAPLVIEDLSTGEKVKEIYPDPITGEYFLTLPNGHLYSYTVKDEQYFPVGDNIDLRDPSKSVNMSAHFVVPTINEMTERGISLPLKNLFFDTDKFDIKEESFPELKRLVEIVKQKNLSIHVSGHTDNVGKAAYNLTLSQNRANAVKTFLIANGCDADNIQASGHGMEQAVASNDTTQGRAQNRRVEIKLMKKI
jgi:outer membrane protein OmpA-like peptidoglycan-associated protein